MPTRGTITYLSADDIMIVPYFTKPAEIKTGRSRWEFSDEGEDTKPGYFGVASFDHRVQEMIFSR